MGVIWGLVATGLSFPPSPGYNTEERHFLHVTPPTRRTPLELITLLLPGPPGLSFHDRSHAEVALCFWVLASDIPPGLA
jgi:hypothetical protein